MSDLSAYCPLCGDSVVFPAHVLSVTFSVERVAADVWKTFLDADVGTTRIRHDCAELVEP